MSHKIHECVTKPGVTFIINWEIHKIICPLEAMRIKQCQQFRPVTLVRDVANHQSCALLLILIRFTQIANRWAS